MLWRLCVEMGVGMPGGVVMWVDTWHVGSDVLGNRVGLQARWPTTASADHRLQRGLKLN